VPIRLSPLYGKMRRLFECVPEGSVQAANAYCKTKGVKHGVRYLNGIPFDLRDASGPRDQ
jgi:hypothetical protein